MALPFTTDDGKGVRGTLDLILLKSDETPES